MKKVSVREFAQVYPSGSVYFGKWIADAGYEGKVTVLSTPECIVVLRKDVQSHVLRRSLELAARQYDDDLKAREVVAEIRGEKEQYDVASVVDAVRRRVTSLGLELDWWMREMRNASSEASRSNDDA